MSHYTGLVHIWLCSDSRGRGTHLGCRLTSRRHVQMKTSRTFIRECSIVSPLSLLLFGGSLEVRHADGITLVDGWLRVRTAAQTAVLVKQVPCLSAHWPHLQLCTESLHV